MIRQVYVAVGSLPSLAAWTLTLPRGVFHMSSGANLRRILHRLAATILEIIKTPAASCFSEVIKRRHPLGFCCRTQVRTEVDERWTVGAEETGIPIRRSGGL